MYLTLTRQPSITYYYVFTAAINRCTHGPMRGIETQRVIDIKGTISIVIAPQFHALVGEHAARMAPKFGTEVRTRDGP